MRRTQQVGFTLLLSAACSVAATAQKPGSTDTLVTSIVSDYDSGVAPALQIQSDKLGAYVTGKAARSAIDDQGTWYVDSYYTHGATRTICLTFSQPIPGTGFGGGAPVAPPNGCYLARISTECFHYGNNLLTLPPGQSMTCPMNVHFDAAGKTYDLHQNPLAVVADFSETNPIRITCIFPTSGTSPCSQWLIQPSVSYVAPDGTTQLRDVANLSQEIYSRGKTTYVKQGDFYISFSIIVTNP